MLYKGGWSEAYAKIFLLLFAGFALVGGLVGLVTGDWILAAIAIVLVVAAGFIWFTYLPPQAGGRKADHIGGGLRMARVVLGPEERVSWSVPVNFAIGNKGVSRLRSFMNNLIGELYLTDRRLIFVPFRLSMRTAPVWLALNDLTSVEESHRPSPDMSGHRSFDLKANNGATIVVRLTDPDPMLDLMAAIGRTAKFAEATSRLDSPEEPGRFALVWLWSVAALFVTLVITTEGVDGLRIPMLGLMAAAIAVAATAGTIRIALNWLRHRSA